MPYDITAINATNSTLAFFQQINELTTPTKLLGNGWTIVLFSIIFFYTLYYTGDFRKAILSGGTVTFLISGLFFMAMGLVSWWIVIAYLVIAITGMIMLFDKDYGS